MAGTVRLGVSGWTFAGGRGEFYPTGLPHRLELDHASERLTSIEINGSFYSLQRPSSYASWRERTPPDFVFSVKGGRFITHLKRLRDVEAPLANFFASGVLALREKLGPVLWQLPEALAFDAEVLDDFLGRLPRTTTEAATLAGRHDDRLAGDRVLATTDADRPIRHALEFRSPSFATPQVTDLLRRHEVATVLADTAGRWPKVEEDTAGFRYVRLHGDAELYASGYSPEALDAWAGKVRGWAAAGQDVFVYFDNDVKGFAPHDAMSLIQRVREA
jgi:uncharacterized protein YecE (DUF72 family)